MSVIHTQVPPDTERLSLSFGELKALCVKAARGCGMDWGTAAEAGFAAVWLSRQGAEGGRLLSDCLKTTEPGPFTLARTGSRWTASSAHPLCPITLGVALLDYAQVPQGPVADGFEAFAVACPALLLPFLARASRERKMALKLEIDESILLIEDGAVVGGLLSGVGNLSCASLRLTAEACRGVRPVMPTVNRAWVQRATLDALNTLALEADVPATDSSRRNAGSGESDND